ncbi:hypothetical protein [Streptomyces sp. NPDC006134]
MRRKVRAAAYALCVRDGRVPFVDTGLRLWRERPVTGRLARAEE